MSSPVTATLTVTLAHDLDDAHRMDARGEGTSGFAAAVGAILDHIEASLGEVCEVVSLTLAGALSAVVRIADDGPALQRAESRLLRAIGDGTEMPAGEWLVGRDGLAVEVSL